MLRIKNYKNIPIHKILHEIQLVRDDLYSKICERTEEFLFDFETKKKFRNLGSNINKRFFGITLFEISEDLLKIDFGCFTGNPLKNIKIVFTDGNQDFFDIVVYNSIQLEEKQLYRNLFLGQYCYLIYGKPSIEYIVRLQTKRANHWPYNWAKCYSAKEFNVAYSTENWGILKTQKSKLDIINSEALQLLKYSYGCEFETSGGMLPVNELIKLGLIPLHDGSISGIEYVTIPSFPEENCLLLKKQVETLKIWTNFDVSCSLHIHLGGFPVDTENIYNLFVTCMYLEPSIQSIFGEYVFNTRLIKPNGKDYCKVLPSGIKDFKSLYRYLSDNQSEFLGNLTEQHPHNNRENRKWNMESRYHWINLINMCFFSGSKTVEFRFLKPTYNSNKIINWIFIFNAILIFAEKITTKEFDLRELCLIQPHLRLQRLLELVYPTKYAKYLISFLSANLVLTEVQIDSGDKTGMYVEPEEILFTNNILELY